MPRTGFALIPKPVGERLTGWRGCGGWLWLDSKIGGQMTLASTVPRMGFDSKTGGLQLTEGNEGNDPASVAALRPSSVAQKGSVNGIVIFNLPSLCLRGTSTTSGILGCPSSTVPRSAPP